MTEDEGGGRRRTKEILVSNLGYWLSFSLRIAVYISLFFPHRPLLNSTGSDFSFFHSKLHMGQIYCLFQDLYLKSTYYIPGSQHICCHATFLGFNLLPLLITICASSTTSQNPPISNSLLQITIMFETIFSLACLFFTNCKTLALICLAVVLHLLYHRVSQRLPKYLSRSSLIARGISGLFSSQRFCC